MYQHSQWGLDNSLTQHLLRGIYFVFKSSFRTYTFFYKRSFYHFHLLKKLSWLLSASWCFNKVDARNSKSMISILDRYRGIYEFSTREFNVSVFEYEHTQTWSTHSRYKYMRNAHGMQHYIYEHLLLIVHYHIPINWYMNDKYVIGKIVKVRYWKEKFFFKKMCNIFSSLSTNDSMKSNNALEHE